MKTSSPPSVRWPWESSQVPSPITSSAPQQLDQVDQRRVERLQPGRRHLGVDSCPRFSRWKRSTSRSSWP